MRRSTRQTQSLNRFAAPRARLACTAIDPKLMLITACPPRSAHVIADGRTASLDRTAQDRDDGPAQALRLDIAKLAAAPSRVEARLEERFVGINVPNTGDDPLIEEHCLEEASRARQSLPPIGAVEIERLRSESRIVKETLHQAWLREQGGATKAADVAKAQLLTVAEVKNHVCMVGQRFVRRRHTKLASHAQMKYEVHPVVENQDNPLAATPDLGNPPADQPRAPLPSPGATELPGTYSNRGDAPLE